MVARARRLPFAFASLGLALAADLASPLPYTTTPAFPGFTVEQPLAIVTPPGETNRLFLIEKRGRTTPRRVTA